MPTSSISSKYQIVIPKAVREKLRLHPGQRLQVLEGKFPYQGRVAVERFRSMKALVDFWNSPAYQEAKKFRNEANFIIAVEAAQ